MEVRLRLRLRLRCSDLIMTTRVRKCRCATSLYLDYYIAPLQPVEAQPAV